MKKILIIIIIFLLTACSTTKNTPTSTVEAYITRYQNLDSNVLKELDNSLAKEKNMSEDQKEIYKDLLEKQYQNLSYKIKNEDVIADLATVSVEIEVLDYATSISNSKKYFLEHTSDFIGKDENLSEENVDENSAYIDYKLKKLKEVKDKTKYEITFELEKDDDSWKIKNLDEVDRRKIHGLY